MAYDGSIKIDTKIDNAGFESGFEKMKAIAAKGVSAVTTSLAAISGGIIAGGTAATQVGASFEAGMSKVSAISGAAGDALQALTDKAKEMGAKTKFSASESAQALQYMSMAGWDTEAMLNGIDGIMSLAAADGLDLATTSDIVTDAITAFGLKAEDSSHFADVLAKASSSANTNVSMLGESFKYVAPLAGTMGYSAEDVSVALGLMANASVKGSMAGTSLKTALSNLASPTQAMADIMERYGISISDTAKMRIHANYCGHLYAAKVTYRTPLCFNNPLIISEGFDPWKLDTFSTEYEGFSKWEDIVYEKEDYNVDAYKFFEDYNVFYVDWYDCGADIRANAEVLKEVIRWVNQNKASGNKNIVLGQSMGGLIARYAFLFSYVP